ncbi:bifunctional riboflavin kinase/FAD synthetase [Porcipelethomonas sp.]|uniref:bifunctional riboflavin kinase/FAD synthetase n=1 Tax=Porcipelethomonas sp. TaxID=2981675 RepID=UPI003EFB21ED
MTIISEGGCTSERCAVALGIFDGVHLGHRKIIGKAMEYSDSGLAPAVFTFNTETVGKKHGKEYEFIYSDSQKRSILEKLGIKYVFSPAVSEIQNMTGEEFAGNVLAEMFRAESVVCGENFRFGKGAACGAEELERFGKKFGFEVCVCGLVKKNGTDISSEIIREMIKNGEIASAGELMGENYFLDSQVITGNKIGRTIDFPTINQKFESRQLIPRKGVYASETYVNGKKYPSVTNIGVKPTVEKNTAPLAETNIIDYTGNLYGQNVRVELYDFIRDEKKFSSLEELKYRINADVHTAMKMYSARNKKII